VKDISKNNGSYHVELSDGRGFECERLAIAIPPTEATRLCERIDPELSSVLGRVNSETIETVGVAVAKEKLSIPLLAGIIPAHDDFYSAVSRDTVPHPTLRGFSFHFKSGKLPLEAKLKRIAQVLRVKPEDLEQPVERVSCLPSPVLGHGRLTDEIDSCIAVQKHYVIGNYFIGMAVEDCIVRSRKEFDRLSRSR
jgi:protoporphyrinogen/coproporphyrinogen III oxidase